MSDHVICGQCQSETIFLGTLGNRVHYRCRGCGIEYSVSIDDYNEWGE